MDPHDNEGSIHRRRSMRPLLRSQRGSPGETTRLEMIPQQIFVEEDLNGQKCFLVEFRFFVYVLAQAQNVGNDAIRTRSPHRHAMEIVTR